MSLTHRWYSPPSCTGIHLNIVHMNYLHPSALTSLTVQPWLVSALHFCLCNIPPSRALKFLKLDNLQVLWRDLLPSNSILSKLPGWPVVPQTLSMSAHCEYLPRVHSSHAWLLGFFRMGGEFLWVTKRFSQTNLLKMDTTQQAFLLHMLWHYLIECELSLRSLHSLINDYFCSESYPGHHRHGVSKLVSLESCYLGPPYIVLIVHLRVS